MSRPSVSVDVLKTLLSINYQRDGFPRIFETLPCPNVSSQDPTEVHSKYTIICKLNHGFKRTIVLAIKTAAGGTTIFSQFKSDFQINTKWLRSLSKYVSSTKQDFVSLGFTVENSMRTKFVMTSMIAKNTIAQRDTPKSADTMRKVKSVDSKKDVLTSMKRKELSRTYLMSS